MSETLTMDNTIETEKIRTHHAKIVVEYTTGEPYYSIEWFDPAKNEYRLGYSSYYIDNVVAWLAEYFEIVEKPKTNADRIRAMTDEELAEFICLSPEMEFDVCRFCQYGNPTPMDDRGECLYDMGRCYAVARAEAMKKWLQQPAEGE